MKAFVRDTLWSDVVLVACDDKGSFERKIAKSLKELREEDNCVLRAALHRIARTVWYVVPVAYYRKASLLLVSV